MESVERTTTFLEVPGGALRAERLVPAGARGRDEGADSPIVFLHEALGSIPMWKGFPARLCAATGRVGLVYERFGSGGSPPLRGPRGPRYLHEEVPVLSAVLEAARIERPVLFGHSDGGTIALLFAAARPEACRAVVAEAAHVFVEETTVAGLLEAEARWRTTDLRARLGRHHGEKTEALFRAWADTWTAPGFRAWNVTGELGALRVPLLVLQGAGDAYGTPAQVEAIAAAVGGPVETRLLPGCGHVPHLERPEEVVAAVEGILSRLGSLG